MLFNRPLAEIEESDLQILVGYHTDCCVTMYDEKALNPVQNWLQGFSAM